MSSVETRPVPVSLLRWPRTRDLITQHKAILLYLWPNPSQTACGCYLLPIDAMAADLSMTASSLADALGEFRRRGLILTDEQTGEIFLPDWFRFYQPKTPAARGAVEAAIRKVMSSTLREKVKKSYESTAEDRKEKIEDKGKVKGKVFAASSLKVGAEGEGGDEPPPGPPPEAGLPSSPERFPVQISGVRCWNASDVASATLLIKHFGAGEVERASGRLVEDGAEPLPSRVEKHLLALVEAKRRDVRLHEEASELSRPVATSAGRQAGLVQIREVVADMKGRRHA